MEFQRPVCRKIPSDPSKTNEVAGDFHRAGVFYRAKFTGAM